MKGRYLHEGKGGENVDEMNRIWVFSSALLFLTHIICILFVQSEESTLKSQDRSMVWCSSI